MTDLPYVCEAKKVIELIYNDALSPPAKEIGKALKDIFRSFRLLTIPFQGLAFIQDKIDIFLEKTLKKVPEENLIIPPGSVMLKMYQEVRPRSW